VIAASDSLSGRLHLAQIIKEGNRWQVSGSMCMPQVESLLAESATIPATKEIEIDLSAVSDVDTATISLLFEWIRQAHGRKCKVTYTNLPENLESLARLYGVLELIPQPGSLQSNSSATSH
jgi:phospholipid transport system transporter-binding protein